MLWTRTCGELKYAIYGSCAGFNPDDPDKIIIPLSFFKGLEAAWPQFPGLPLINTLNFCEAAASSAF